jgi:hypothetical protein
MQTTQHARWQVSLDPSLNRWRKQDAMRDSETDRECEVSKHPVGTQTLRTISQKKKQIDDGEQKQELRANAECNPDQAMQQLPVRIGTGRR